MKFYRCMNCDEVIIVRNEAKGIKCCGEEMVELIPNSSDASPDTHIPYIRKIGNLITIYVGKTPHPMLAFHHIDFIALETDKGFYYKHLEIGSEAIADFMINNQEKVIKAYIYCNLHFLWENCEVINGIDLLAKSEEK